MTPYYEKNGIAIYHGDCESALGDIDCVDLIVADPPYGMQFQSNHRVTKHKKIAGDDQLPIGVINQLIAKAESAAYVFCRWDNLREMPKPKSVLAWVKNNWSMGDLNHEHGRQWEACCFYPSQGHEFVKRIPDVIHATRTGNKLHPTQKPVSLIEKIIAANRGEVVLDPYMGSGTTLVAARNCGRKAIGIEMEEEYCEIAANRLSQGVLF
jgi:site-specific DNA-methyltransferase (adenine-specific)